MSDQADDPYVFQRPSRAHRSEGTPTDHGPLLHERLQPYSEFCLKEWPVIRFSPNGRLAFLLFERDLQLQVLDLVRNTQMQHCCSVFKADRTEEMDVFDFAALSPTAILVLEPHALWLFRLDVNNGKLELCELERRPDSWPVYVFTEINGTDVQLKRVVLNQCYSTELRFVRLDVDAARLEVDAVEQQTAARDYRLSPDGCRLYGLSTYSMELNTLHVFDILQRKWSTKELSGQLEGCTFAWTADRVFLSGYKEVDGDYRSFVFCLDLRQHTWTKLPIVAANIRHISAIVDEEGGEAGGLVILNEDEKNKKMEVFRVLYRTPDSLVRLAVDALRRHNLDVVGKEEFHAVMNGPCKGVFPSLYAGMTPIPRL
ncbi:hypothetical protein M3Y99_00829100 [Aphelenchoides fujianensis]|nr:hypothetical protein M3Y99_00829100 [Aphelenchoides fujianensis]